MESLIYLDTHAVVWLYGGELGLFPKTVLEELERSRLLVSPMVRLELQYLQEIKKIKTKPDKILEGLGKSIGLEICSRPFAEVVGEAMGQSWTRDPFDRIIVSQASLARKRLLTKDAAIRAQFRDAFWD